MGMNNQSVSSCVELVTMSQRPHDPFESLDEFTQLLKCYCDLPLYSALHLPRRLLKHKILVRGVKDALLKRIIGRLCRGRVGWILNPSASLHGTRAILQCACRWLKFWQPILTQDGNKYQKCWQQRRFSASPGIFISASKVFTRLLYCTTLWLSVSLEAVARLPTLDSSWLLPPRRALLWPGRAATEI